MKEKIVVSGINIYQGGAMTVLKGCLDFLEKTASSKYHIIALVHKKSMFDYKNIEVIEFPLSRKSWIARLYYEFVYFQNFSKQTKPLLWFSMHDITPNVTSNIQVVYCHNASAFYKSNVKELFLDPSFFLFSTFYKYLYKINIHRNNFIIVQQGWLRNKFRSLFEVNNVIVSHLNDSASEIVHHSTVCSMSEVEPNRDFIFFYPTFPRVFKNIEIICKAVEHLFNCGISNFKFIVTIDGSENKYSQEIVNSFSSILNIDFIGTKSYSDIQKLYHEVDCLIFPSKLESWGLPLTEFKKMNKCILCADLDYAHETIGNYDLVNFFDPSNSTQLAQLMSNLIKGINSFDGSKKQVVEAPFTQNWEELFDIILN